MTFFNLPRNQVQLISVLFFLSGVLFYLSSNSETGSVLMGIGFYVIIMSESTLLARVQGEMTNTIETLGKKRELEIRELLYFLKKSKMACSPFEAIEAASRFAENLKYPAMVISPNFMIIKSNNAFTELLGYELQEIEGGPVSRINNLVVMSEVGRKVTQSAHNQKESMAMRYVYIHKSGLNIFGNLTLNKIKGGGFLIYFHPDKDMVIDQGMIISMVKSTNS